MRTVDEAYRAIAIARARLAHLRKTRLARCLASQKYNDVFERRF
ncbi:hypothetical protein [Nostoc sp.]